VMVIAQGSVIAEGSVESIRSRVALRKIRCISSLDISTIKQWPHIDSVTQDGQYMTIQTMDAESVARRLLNEDAGLKQLEIKRAGLAEAFIELTKEQA